MDYFDSPAITSIPCQSWHISRITGADRTLISCKQAEKEMAPVCE